MALFGSHALPPLLDQAIGSFALQLTKGVFTINHPFLPVAIQQDQTEDHADVAEMVGDLEELGDLLPV